MSIFGSRYKIVGAHIRPDEETTIFSVKSPDPNVIIGWLGEFISKHFRCEVLFDHDYSEEDKT